jgi:hypothetical protein
MERIQDWYKALVPLTGQKVLSQKEVLMLNDGELVMVRWPFQDFVMAYRVMRRDDWVYATPLTWRVEDSPCRWDFEMSGKGKYNKVGPGIDAIAVFIPKSPEPPEEEKGQEVFATIEWA